MTSIYKNCTPTIKNEIIQFLSKFKIKHYDTELSHIEIFENHYDNPNNYDDNILFRLREYIIKENEFITWNIHKNLDKHFGVNNNFCDVCDVYCGTLQQLIIHKSTLEHITRDRDLLLHKYDNIKSQLNIETGLKNNKNIRIEELLRQINTLQDNITLLKAENYEINNQKNRYKNKYYKSTNKN